MARMIISPRTPTEFGGYSGQFENVRVRPDQDEFIQEQIERSPIPPSMQRAALTQVDAADPLAAPEVGNGGTRVA